jgi:hypothetical protein
MGGHRGRGVDVREGAVQGAQTSGTGTVDGGGGGYRAWPGWEGRGRWGRAAWARTPWREGLRGRRAGEGEEAAMARREGGQWQLWSLEEKNCDLALYHVGNPHPIKGLGVVLLDCIRWSWPITGVRW